MKLTYGDVILNEAQQSEYFHNIFRRLTIQYGNKIFDLINTENVLEQSELIDLLKFADIFSKSNVTEKISLHRNIAQEIVSMIDYIKNDYDSQFNSIFLAYEKSIYNSVSNYIASDKIEKSETINNDFLYRMASDIKKSLNRIPDTENSYFFDDQKLAIHNMQDNQYYSFSAPTSMGKTFIIKNFIKILLKQSLKQNIAIVVPTKALINELEDDLLSDLEDFIKNDNYMIITVPTQLQLFKDKNKILIFTPERMLQAINENLVNKLDYVFIDEAQKIFEEDERAPLYYKLINTFNKKFKLLRICFSSPYSETPEELLKLIDMSYLKNKQELSQSNKFEFSPVVQKQFIVDTKTKQCSIFNKLENTFEDLGLVNIDWVSHIAKQLKKGSTIVYCKSKHDVIKYANEFAETIDDISDDNDIKIKEFIDFIKNEVHESYYLIPLLKKRIAFHMGIMPSEIRKTIEKYVKEGIIKIVFCTSTLLEGVNLPAVNIFVLSHKKSTTKMKSLDFKNLIGRAGRIKYSLWGNSFLLNLTDNDSIIQYKTYLTEKPQNESLNPYVENRKTSLVPSIFDHNYVIEKKSNETYSKLQNFIMYRNLVLESIITQTTDSYIYKAYESDIQKQIESGNTTITNDINDIDDILFAPETIKKVKDAILYNAIKMPNLKAYNKNSYISDEEKKNIWDNNRREIYDFLFALHTYFQWEIFESKDNIGNTNRLSYYAGLIASWIMGHRLGKIIYSEIEFHNSTKKIWNKQLHTYEEYTGSQDQKNQIINETLEDIENTIQYSICNYVKKYIQLYEEFLNLSLTTSVYDYIEYGTMNDDMITLQKMGISRDLSNELIKQGLIIISDQSLKIQNIDSLKSKDKYSFEIQQIKTNLNSILI